MLKDIGKKLIFRASFAKWLLRNTRTAEDSRVRAQQPEPGAGWWQSTEVKSRFPSYFTLIQPLLRPALSSSFKTGSWSAKPPQLQTHSRPLPRAHGYIKLHQHETLWLCIIYPYSHPHTVISPCWHLMNGNSHRSSPVFVLYANIVSD